MTIDNSSTTKAGNKGNLISMEESPGDKFLTREYLLKKLGAPMELLKKREGDGIPQRTYGVHVWENREDTWERTVESKKL